MTAPVSPDRAHTTGIRHRLLTTHRNRQAIARLPDGGSVYGYLEVVHARRQLWRIRGERYALHFAAHQIVHLTLIGTPVTAIIVLEPGEYAYDKLSEHQKHQKGHEHGKQTSPDPLEDPRLFA